MRRHDIDWALRAGDAVDRDARKLNEQGLRAGIQCEESEWWGRFGDRGMDRRKAQLMKRHETWLKTAFLMVVLWTWAYPAVAYYDPGVQRWINRDPIGERGGVNLFQFGGNSPMTVIDPDGRSIVGGILSTVALKGLCAATIAMDVLKERENMADPRWRHAHCMASCRISQLCGNGTAVAAGLAKEFVDLVRCLKDKIMTGRSDTGACYSAFQPSDFKDNEQGRSCPNDKTCDEQCDDLKDKVDGPPGPFYEPDTPILI